MLFQLSVFTQIYLYSADKKRIHKKKILYTEDPACYFANKIPVCHEYTYTTGCPPKRRVSFLSESEMISPGLRQDCPLGGAGLRSQCAPAGPGGPDARLRRAGELQCGRI